MPESARSQVLILLGSLPSCCNAREEQQAAMLLGTQVVALGSNVYEES